MVNGQFFVGTDAYGTVPERVHKAWIRANVSPSDHFDLTEKFGEDWDAMTYFVDTHTRNGQYTPPWPFPYDN